MSKTRLYVAIFASVVLAIPAVTLVSSFVVFPILFYAALAVIANFGPVAYFAAAGAQRIGLRFDIAPLREATLYCGIIWVGCAFGLSRWGDVGQAIGAKNEPYLDVLFAPWIFAVRHLIA
ncbi:MAG: hypothetical protein JNM89_09045 [Hyphomicrobiaceae bacterium]|nr:hypothetical protein [Hyphomicrobiaceae bacterium]